MFASVEFTLHAIMHFMGKETLRFPLAHRPGNIGAIVPMIRISWANP